MLLLVILYTATLARFGVPSNDRQHLRKIYQNDLVHPCPYLPNEPQRQRPTSGSGIQDPDISTGAIASSVGQATTQNTSVNANEFFIALKESKYFSHFPKHQYFYFAIQLIGKQNLNVHFARTLENVLENQEEVRKELRALKESRRNESSEDEYQSAVVSFVLNLILPNSVYFCVCVFPNICLMFPLSNGYV